MILGVKNLKKCNITSYAIKHEGVHSVKVNESRYKQCWVTLHFTTGQTLLKKKLRRDKYLHTTIN